MEKDCQYLSWENAPIGPLLGHAAHLARERMDVRLAQQRPDGRVFPREVLAVLFHVSPSIR